VIKLRKIRWEEKVADIGDEKCTQNFSRENQEGKRPLRRPRHRWEDIRMDIEEIECGGRDSTGPVAVSRQRGEKECVEQLDHKIELHFW
jgi:hypothetical protein